LPQAPRGIIITPLCIQHAELLKMARFERVPFNPDDWNKTLSSFPDRIVFQSAEWISFLAETQKGEPVIAALKEGNETLGYFSGLMVRKFGLKILGSPFRGWSTPFMGFNLNPKVPRRTGAEALADFAFNKLGCIHFEVADLFMSLDDIDGLGLNHLILHSMEVDLSQSEEDIFSKMSKSCRWTIRKGEKNGVTIEEATDDAFADEFGDQLKDVFAKQGLVPHYGAARILSKLKHLRGTGKVLFLRARDSEGHCIATGVFPALHETAFYNEGASWRQFQKSYPNELLHWHAMRYWKKRGMRAYNMVGTMHFKQKFGGRMIGPPMIFRSKYRVLERLRQAAVPRAKAALHLLWKIKTLGKRQKGVETKPETEES